MLHNIKDIAKDIPDVMNPPCNGCVRCCLGDAIRILPEEDPSKWETEDHPYFQGSKMLKHKPTGECYYLDLENKRCSIHGDAPTQCKEMDCRLIALLPNRTIKMLQKQGTIRITIYEKGKELLRSMNMELEA